MKRDRRKHSFKARVALEALKSEETTAERASRFEGGGFDSYEAD